MAPPFFRRSLLTLLAVAPLAFALPLRAEPLPSDLLARLSGHAQAFEAMRTRASYAVQGRMEQLDGDGNVDEVKEMHARVEADGSKARFIVIKYVEGGEDKTDDARQKARDRESKKKPDDKVLRMPFLAGEQARYRFDLLEHDKADDSRVRIGFVPKEPEEDTIEGSAWVDTKTARVLSAGFKLSKPGTFVDFVRVTLRFDADTSLGPALSAVSFEGKGGVLFFRKRFRGSATLSDYRISP